MDVGQILSDSIDYSKKLFEDLGRLLILIVLDIIPIVNLVVLGYICRVIKEPQDSKELPSLKDYLSLWVQGLKVTVALIIYLIVPIILLSPFILLIVAPWVPSLPLAPAGLLLAVPTLIVGILLAFFIAIILAMAIVHMVKNDSFGKAFAIGEILDIIGKIGWGTYILWLIVIFVCAVIVGSIGSIPTIGWLLSLVIAPIFGVFASRSASLIYSAGAPPMVEKLPAPPEALPTAPKPPKEKKYCVYCGAEIAAEAIYCPECGRKQEA